MKIKETGYLNSIYNEFDISDSQKMRPGEFLMQQITRNYTLSFAELLSEHNKVINYQNKNS